MSCNLLFFIRNVLVLCHSQEVAVLWACQPPPAKANRTSPTSANVRTTASSPIPAV